MTCQNQAGYGIFSEVHSWKMIKLKKSKDNILKSTDSLKKNFNFQYKRNV